MLRQRQNKYQFIILFGYGISVLGILLLPGIISTAVNLLYVVIAIYVAYRAICRNNRTTSTTVLLLPVWMSVCQNIYLGLAIHRLSATTLQVLLSLHFLLFTGVVLMTAPKAIHRSKWEILAAFVLCGYSFALYLVYPSNITSAISSIRNILSCVLLYCFGIAMSRLIDKEKYYRIIRNISWFVVAFGFAEWLSDLKLWQALNITELWELKGIQTNIGGIPPNWYSSEQIGGSIVRRMVSSFADPVNLGTFLFAAFMISWYRKERILTYALALCALLTVSKGSLLGFLVFIVVYVWQRKKFRILIPIMGGIALAVGIWFVQYSMRASTGSMLAHVWGFISSFSVLLSHPLGLGVGNVGVLAGLFNESLLNMSVSETGIGMIIAQLGIVGLCVYIFFFIRLGIMPGNWQKREQREKVLYYSLLFSFLANALFNEVALSPNSCSLYFIELACLNNVNSKSSFHSTTIILQNR